MAETIEEIASLLQSIKMDNELSNEDFSKLLNEIKNRVTELHDYNEAAAVAAAIQQTIDSKSLVDNEKMRELDETLRQLRIKVDSAQDISELTEQVHTLAENFRSGFESVVSFANKDADAKNLLLDRMGDLEQAVKNGAMIETLRQRTDDLVKGYENFISDSNLRHGNMVSALVDLKNKIDDYSSKNNYVFGSISHTIEDASNKLTSLESTVSSNLGNVNSKLYSMGDDIKKILNDGFDHLKYLSSNMSEAMNSNSLDMKTTLEVLKANISDFTEHLKDEFGAINRDLSDKISNGNDAVLTVNNDIINNVKEVGNIISSKANDYETILNEKSSNIIEFVNALQEAISVFKNENNTLLNDKLSELGSKLNEITESYEKMLIHTSEEIRNVSDAVVKTSDDIVTRLKNTDIEEVYNVKQALLESSSNNLNTILERIQGVTDSVDGFKASTADNLTTYLNVIKELFTDFSSKVETTQNNTEVLEKLSNLEILMSRFDIEKNENFAQLQLLIKENAEAIKALRGIEDVINQHSNSKDEKLANIENLINKFDNEKNENFSKLMAFIGENSNSKEEKLAHIENLINKFDNEKNENFSKLMAAFSENSEAVRSLNGITDIINEQNSTNDIKLANIENLINKFDREKNDNFAKLMEILQHNSEAIEALNIRTGSSLGLEKIENLIRENSSAKDEKLSNLEVLMSRFDFEKNENFEHLQALLNKNAEAINSLKNQNTTQEFDNLRNLINEQNYYKDEKLENLKNIVSEYKDIIGKLGEDIHSQSERNYNELNELKIIANDMLPQKSSIEQLSDLINNKAFDCKDSILGEINSVKDSINSITEKISSATDADDNSAVTLKLTELNNRLTESSDNYEHALSLLSTRLEEYIEAAEGISATTNTKLDITAKEFSNIQDRFNALSEQLNNLIGESGLIEILANIRQQFSVVKDQLKDETTGIVSGIETSITDNIIKLNTSLIQLRENVEEIHDKQLENFGGLIFNIEGVRTDVNSALATIEKIIAEKISAYATDFKPVEDAIKEFTEVKYAQTLNDVKEQLELSYVNLTNEVKDLINNNGASNEINEAFKTSVQKLDLLESMVRDSVSDNIEAIKNTLFNVCNMVQSNVSGLEEIQTMFNENLITLGNKINESQNEITSSIIQELQTIKAAIDEHKDINADDLKDVILPLINNNELIDVVRSLNKNLADKITDFKQDNDLANQDIINIINSVNDTVEYILETVNSKFEHANDNASDIIKNIETLNAKLDVIVMALDDTELLESIEDINEQIQTIKDEIAASAQTKNNINSQEIIERINTLTANSNSNFAAEFEEIKSNLNDLTSQTQTILKYEALIETLNSKLDIIAMNDMSETIDDNFDELHDAIGKLSEEFKAINNPTDILNTINNKIDILAQSENNDVLENITDLRDEILILKKDLTSTETNLENYLRAMDSTLDVLTTSHETNLKLTKNVEEVKGSISNLENNIQSLDGKIDILAQMDNEEVLAEIEDIKSALDSSASRLKKFADDTDGNINELKEQISNTESAIEDYSRTLDCKLDEISQFTSVNEKLENIKSDVKESLKLEDLINKLNSKVDILAMSDDSDVIDEIYSIKTLVEEQMETLQSSVEDTTQVQKLMDALNKIDKSIVELDFSKQAKEIRESVISAVVSVTNEISFVEEADEIKDYVGEKTNELHRLLMDVKHQLYTITNTADDMDMYSYTLQDVESDLAKLRLVINDFADKKSENELVVISANLNKMARAMDDLRTAVVDTEIKRAARNDIGNVNDELLSISSRLNKYILSRRESDSKISDKLDAIAELSSSNVVNKIEQALIETDKKLEYTTNIITVLKNVMMYLGEWMDGTTETLTSIYDRTAGYSESLELIPPKKELYEHINEKFNQLEADMENLQNVADNTISHNELKAEELQAVLESRIAKQETRLDRIEKAIDRIATIMEASGSNYDTMDRIDKLEEKIAKLNKNIEKLTAYVE
ncbi:hypothetical protein IKP85_03705 [bacterium]|nr:hypothetical protein [bacterium]